METFSGIWAGLGAIIIGGFGMFVQRKKNRELLTFLMASSKMGVVTSLAACRFTFKALYASCIAPESWEEDPACVPIAALIAINVIFYGLELIIYFTYMSLTIRLFCAPPSPPKPQQPPQPQPQAPEMQGQAPAPPQMESQSRIEPLSMETAKENDAVNVQINANRGASEV